MEAPDDFSYQFTATGKSNKSKAGKANISVGKSGKSSTRSSKRSKIAGDEPIRNLRATLDEVDLDRGAKPSKRLR